MEDVSQAGLVEGVVFPPTPLCGKMGQSPANGWVLRGSFGPLGLGPDPGSPEVPGEAGHLADHLVTMSIAPSLCHVTYHVLLLLLNLQVEGPGCLFGEVMGSRPHVQPMPLVGNRGKEK